MSKFYASSRSCAAVICKNSDGKLVVKKFKVDFDRKQLMEIGDLCWNTKMKVEILATDSVEETLTGQVVPVALVRLEEKSSTITCYVVCIDFYKDQILPLRKFETKLKYILCADENQTCSGKNVFILHGPLVVVCYKSKLFVYYGDQLMVMEEFSFDAETLTDRISVCCRQCKVSFRYQDLLESTTFHDKNILFLLVQVKLRCTEHGPETRNIVNVLQFSGKQLMVLNTRLFIPDEYIDCVRSIKSITCLDSDLHNYELYLGTSEGYIIHVKNGSLVQCCSLSEQYSVSCIKMSSGLDNNTGILAKTGDVWTEITKTFQVKNKYSGIKHIFMEDFLQNGSFQFLLLKGDVGEGAPWVVTDLKTQSLTSDEDKPSEQTGSSKSSSTAVKALKARLQRDQILLHDEEAQLRRQAEFITDMFAKQVSVAAGLTLKSQTHEPTLVNLITGSEGKHQFGRNQSRTGSQPVVEVKGHWQRTYKDSWCIGVDVVCNSNRPTKVWLDVVLNKTYTRTVSMKSSCLTLSGYQNGSLAESGNKNGCQSEGNITVTPGASITGIQSTGIAPAKLQKLTDGVKAKSFQCSEPGEMKDKMYIERVSVLEGTVVCVIPLPVFGSLSHVTAKLILNWTHPDENIEQCDFDKFDKINKNRVEEEEDKGNDGAGGGRADGEVGMKGVHTYCCEKVTLKAEDILHSKYELDFHVETGAEDESMADFKDLRNNQLAWKHVQTAHHLVISSSPGTLARFESLLTDTCGFAYNQHYDCYVSMITALRGVQLQLAPQTSDESRLLIVYTSICAEKNITQEAEKHCVECQAYYCIPCSDLHMMFPLMRGHKLLDKTSFGSTQVKSTVPCFPTEVCSVHKGRLLDMFCRNHDEIVCATCVALNHRQDKDLFLTIHHLYAHLPDHTVILPRESSSADIQRCQPALQKEADFLSRDLTKLLSDHEAENASKDSDDGEEDDLRKIGEKFKRKREKILKRQGDVMRVEEVKQFIERYKRIQDLTDLAVITAHNAM